MMLANVGAALKRPFWRWLWEVRGKQEDLMAARGGADLKVQDLDNALTSVLGHLRLDASRDSVLDIGCGVGYMAERLAPRVKHVTATDHSSTLVARAQVALSRFPNAEALQAEAAKIPKPDGSFTRIVCYGVLHYFPSRAYLLTFLREIRRLLTDDGFALVGDISEKGKFDFDIADRFGPIKRMYYVVTTVFIDTLLQTRFSRAEIVRLAQQAGLEATVVDQPSTLAFHASRFDVLLRRTSAGSRSGS
jgi:cyclopropane fatty-acyl-phospholipid synthase-like methyltransferase